MVDGNFPEGTPSEQGAQLLKAQQAARIGDTRTMAIALHESFVLDGLKRRLRKNLPYLKPDQVDAIIAQSVDALFQAIQRDDKVSNLGGYLWKVCHQIGTKVNFGNSIVRPVQPDVLVARSDSNAARAYISGVEEDDDEASAKRCAQAIAIARSLLPEIGQVHAQQVMEYILDAVATGRVDVPNGEIAAALGLTPENVRQLRKRGFERLERAARQRGIAPDGFDIPDDDEEDEDRRHENEDDE